MIKVLDIPGSCWPQLVDHGPFVDRSETLVADYWRSKNIEFTLDPKAADVLIRKAELSFSVDDSLVREEKVSKAMATRPSILMIGEPRELAAAAYHFADPTRTLAVAPGAEFQRMYFGRPWSDPQLENWKNRLDRFVWIGRPIGHRLSIAQNLVKMGLPLDIYSREPWPLDCWKGPAADDVETARAYKYRIACENSNTALYHSEKLFTSLRSGCMTFYWGDPKLDLNFVERAYLPLTAENLSLREERAPKIIQGMSHFMFSNSWEVYSIRSFIDRTAELVHSLAGGKSNAELSPASISILRTEGSTMRFDESLSNRKA